jgi:phage tail sheath protein FI
MMPQALTYPGVYIEEVSSGVRTITGVATSIALFIGWAPKGPTDRAVRITSFADYDRTYGGYDIRSLLGYAVSHFFANGGSDAYVIRIASTAAPIAQTARVVIGDLTINASSPGIWANKFNVVLQKRTDPGFTDRFRIDVVDPSDPKIVFETFPNLSVTAGDPRYVLAVINGNSAYLDKLSLAANPTAPNNTAAGGVGLGSGQVGVDGTVIGPADAAFRNQLAPLFALGNAADSIDLFNILCVPGLTNATTIQALQKIARDRRAIMLVDCDQNASLASVQTGLPVGPDAANAAFYFPWVRAPDPLQSGNLSEFPPSGFVAGVLARTDSTRGVWKAPAGTDAGLNGVAELKVKLSDLGNGQLNPLGINCLRDFPVYGKVVWGSRTLHGDNNRGSEWKYLPVRRMALFLEESLYRGTKWVVFEPNDEPLWAQIRLNIGAFLQGLFRQGAFQGKTPRDAYFVKCDRETTTQADINLGIVNIHVGFAPLKPAEFVVLKIQQMAGEIPT